MRIARTSTCIALIAFLLCLLLSSPSALRAQVVGATLEGTVTDPHGNVVQGATVTLRNLEQGVGRVVTTNRAGEYTAPNLVPGPYQVVVTAPGFSKQVKNGVTLTVGERPVINVQLSVSSVSTTVEVQATGANLEEASSALSGVVSGQTTRELPLNGRDWTQLAALQPGVALVRSQPDANSTSSRGNRGFATQFTIAGGRPQQNSYRLDGIITNDYANAGPGSTAGITIGVDSLQEFSIVTSNYSAAYGFTSGGVINALTRAGSNQFHGSAYEFVRNDVFDARAYFDTPGTAYPFRQNQYGATFGGPIIHDRSFIFGNYEGFDKVLASPTLSTVPSPAARGDSNGNTVGTINGTNYTINPQAARYLVFYPEPNTGTVSTTTGAGTYSFAGKEFTPEQFFTIRFDQTITAKDSLYATYLFDTSSTTLPDPLNTTLGASNARRQTLSVAYNHIFSDRFYNSLRLGANREFVGTLITRAGASSAAASTSYGAAPGLYAPSIQISSFATFNGGLNSSGATTYGFTTPQIYDDAFFSKGHHTLKFGFAFERIMNNMLVQVTPDGTYKFTSLATYLQNQPNSLQVQVTPAIPRDIRQSVVGGYLEDDWRLRANFTITGGIRYEMSTVPTETANRLANIQNFTATAPVLGSPLFMNPTLKNFEPRLGFSYSPAFSANKFNVSGGYGIFDVLPLTYQFNLMVTQNAPYILNLSGTPAAGSFPSAGYTQIATTGTGKPRETYIQFNPPRNYVQQYNLTLQQQLPWNINLKVAWVGSHAVHQAFRTTDANIPTPVQIGGRLVFPCAAYVAGLTNISCKTPAPPIAPTFGQIDGQNWSAGASYNGLIFQLKQILHKQFQYQASVTYQKSLDGNSSVIAGGPLNNSISGQFLFHPLRGASDFDVKRVVVVNGVWTVPDLARKGSFASYVANGYEMAGIFQASDGQPFTPVFAGDVNGDGNTSTFDVPDRIIGPGCTGNPVNIHNFDNYIKQQCFTTPLNTVSSSGTVFGDAGRNSIFGPAYVDFDYSLLKNIPIAALGKEAHLQLRAEMFNIFNRPNIIAPYSNNRFAIQGIATPQTIPVGTLIPSGSTGQATTSFPPRQIQLGAKLVF